MAESTAEPTTPPTRTPPPGPPPPRARHPLAAQTEARYRALDQLRAGDVVPTLALQRLDGGQERLDSDRGARPLVLVFGSCT